MAMLTMRNLPDEVHRALRLRAARHGRSTEAEVRAILVDARTGLNDAEEVAIIGRRDKVTSSSGRL
jgi:plasmid stability protein